MTVRVQVRAATRWEEAKHYLVRLGGWTLERYLAAAPENAFWEFVHGEVIVPSPVTAEHQDLVRFLLRILDGYCEARGWGKVLMGPAALQILPEVVREPDLFVLAPEDVPRAHGVPLTLRPVLVVEVISPATRSMDLGEKAREYAQARIPEYWAVDPERKDLWVHRLHEDDYTIHRLTYGRVESQVLPGFWLRAEWLWEDPLPPASRCLAKILGEEENSTTGPAESQS